MGNPSIVCKSEIEMFMTAGQGTKLNFIEPDLTLTVGFRYKTVKPENKNL